MPDPQAIRIVGARQHNLKNLTVGLPRNRFIVITGPSGSGKSSLAFDTLYAEGQRRYMQSLSAYARQFLEQMEKPAVDRIDGLSPAIAVDQRGSPATPRSTVATTTEIHDYLRVLFAAAGVPHHPRTGAPLQRLTTGDIAQKILAAPHGARFLLNAPVASQIKNTPVRQHCERLRREGFIRVCLDGTQHLIEELPTGAPQATHDLEVVIDRLAAGPDLRSRLQDSLELALRLGQGIVHIRWLDDPGPGGSLWKLSNQDYDPLSGERFAPLGPRDFSFNNPHGACPVCEGLGTEWSPDPALVIPDNSLSLSGDAIAPWRRSNARLKCHYRGLLRDLAHHARISLDTPWEQLPEPTRHWLLHGSSEPVERTLIRNGEPHTRREPFEGILANVRNLHDTAKSPLTRARLRAFMTRLPCSACGGARLHPRARAVLLGPDAGGRTWNLPALCALPIAESRAILATLQLPAALREALRDALAELHARLGFLDDIGLGYLSLDRETHTLSGGEHQRIRLATQIGSGLSGVLYVLDEPSIGLHQRDTQRLLDALLRLRDLGNTLVVVEHDEEVMRRADHLIDLGPGAGAAGGRLIAQGTPQEVAANPDSPTGRFLAGSARLSLPSRRRPPDGRWLTVHGARAHNLKNLTAAFPLGCLTCVTGVSGSGKSTLVNDILGRALRRTLHRARETPAAHDTIEGLEAVERVILIDQSPPGQSSRSNPATYSGAFDPIRDLFARLPSARIRGYNKSRFSFNTPGGRCERCQGDGFLRIEMNLLPEAHVECEACGGRRYNRETLEVTYHGRSIADVLHLTVAEALDVFSAHPDITGPLGILHRVGLGYLSLGQPANTLSGGEAQRLKLAAELARPGNAHTLYLLDEPTSGLHFIDIEMLLDTIFALRNAGHSVVVIEHHLDVIKSADHVIDLGPGGGNDGGRIVATGTPEQIAACLESFTGRWLRSKLTESTRISPATHEANELF